MNSVAYEGKRAHWCFVWFMNRALREAARKVKHKRSVLSDMTPARYDVLYAVFRRTQWKRRNRARRPLLPFASLVRKLGLAISTVSEIVRRMHELGLVRRFKATHDRRVTLVQITSLGVKCFHAAQRAVRFARANLAQVLGGAPLYTDEIDRIDGWPCDGELMEMFAGVARDARRVALHFGSRAEPMYDASYLEDCGAQGDLPPWRPLVESQFWRQRGRPRTRTWPGFGSADDDAFDERI